MDEETLTKEEQATMMIDQLMNVRQIKHAVDREKELDRQERVLTAKLEALGVTVSNLPD